MTEILICEYSNYSIRRLHRIGQYSFYWKVISIPSLLFGKAGYEVLVCVITAPSILFFEPCLATVAMLDHFFCWGKCTQLYNLLALLLPGKALVVRNINF